MGDDFAARDCQPIRVEIFRLELDCRQGTPSLFKVVTHKDSTFIAKNGSLPRGSISTQAACKAVARHMALWCEMQSGNTATLLFIGLR
jgi:hypothetical protein